jgi:biopolymer transport protein TolR
MNAPSDEPFGRLGRSPAGAPMSDINMTPLIDVMLVLLVIFIITAPLMVSAVRVDLPRSAAAAPLQLPPMLEVTLDANGQVLIDNTLRAPEAVATALQAAARVNPDTEVRLRADATVPYGRVVELMGQAQAAGLSRIAFVAQRPAAQSQ